MSDAGEILIPQRYWSWGAFILLTLASLGLSAWSAVWLAAAAVFGVISLIGLLDFLQPKRAIRRNYPVIGHLRFFLEYLRPEIRQYFIESDTEAIPFARSQRSLAYQRAKGAVDKRPFGTLLDVYEPQYEWINHSISPKHLDSHDFRITIGAGRCVKPYSASIFNISAMSFGSLSANAVLALNEGARRGGFYHDTGEGSISKWHRQPGGDLVWEVGSGYFGCRDEKGNFDPERFRENAVSEQVKMIEIKLSQGAKPGHGGVLPGSKVTGEIARSRGVPEGIDCVSPSAHSAFSTPVELLEFVAQLRELSGGKPVGFKLAIGHPWEWFSIVKAMQHTGLVPDFVVVDGGEGGTGAAPIEFSDHVGTPLREGLMLVHNALVGVGLRDQIKVGASGKVITAFDIARTIALGADWCNAARGFMFALGCIQAQTCHTGKCPTGVTTQDPGRMRALVVPEKADRVFDFHRSTMETLKDLVGAAGLNHPCELGPEHIIRRISSKEVRSLAGLHKWVITGDLNKGVYRSPVFKSFWEKAPHDSFSPPASMLVRQKTKSA
ncbi:MAG: FMN-binding glutamate synthase family protein [Gammaproteobacteria bacterium]|nr:FMN-binding glutamate synthase family protein [Gammaproteobacteria bacterium]